MVLPTSCQEINFPDTTIEEAVIYTNMVNTEVDGNGDLKVSSSTGSPWTNGANSVQSVYAGDYIEFEINSTTGNSHYGIGLSYQDGGQSISSINYLWYINIFGTYTGLYGHNYYTTGAPPQVGDTYSIHRENGNIVYRKNGVTVRTEVDNNPSQAMIVDISLNSYSVNPPYNVVVGRDYSGSTQSVCYGNGSEGDYRYGFNGMETDDEVKGTKNSYDFVARLYDPRVGRWLSTDPLAAKQPDQSPYKTMLNNPIFWVDPAGETEYETIIIKDERTGAFLKVSRPISGKLKTTGAFEAGGWPVTRYGVSWYDYSHVTKYTFTTDGEVVIDTYTETLVDNGAKMSEWCTLDHAFGVAPKSGDIYDTYKQSGGFYMTAGSGGGGDQTKYYSDDPEYVGDISVLLDIMSGYKAKGNFKVNNKGFENTQAWDGIQDLMDQLGHNFKKVGKIEDLIPKIKEAIQETKRELGVEPSGGSIPGNTNTYSNTTIWRMNEDGIWEGSTKGASDSERVSGDTLNGSLPKTNITITPSGETLSGTPAENNLK